MGPLPPPGYLIISVLPSDCPGTRLSRRQPFPNSIEMQADSRFGVSTVETDRHMIKVERIALRAGQPLSLFPCPTVSM